MEKTLVSFCYSNAINREDFIGHTYRLHPLVCDLKLLILYGRKFLPGPIFVDDQSCVYVCVNKSRFVLISTLNTLLVSI